MILGPTHLIRLFWKKVGEGKHVGYICHFEVFVKVIKVGYKQLKKNLSEVAASAFLSFSYILIGQIEDRKRQKERGKTIHTIMIVRSQAILLEAALSTVRTFSVGIVAMIVDARNLIFARSYNCFKQISLFKFGAA